MSKKAMMGVVSWMHERAERSSDKLVETLCDERKYDMAAIPIELVRLMHTTALFKTLRAINTPDYLISRDMEVGEEVLSEYAQFLDALHIQIQEMARSIRDWQPMPGSEEQLSKKAPKKRSHPSNN